MVRERSRKRKKQPAPKPDSHWGPGLALLAEARRLALDAGVEPWKYAVELRELRAAGFTVNDLRRCTDLGWLAHAEERAVHGKGRRRFRSEKEHSICPSACFILTEAGAAAHLALSAGNRDAPVGDGRRAAGGSAAGQQSKPHWDRDSGMLTFKGKVVKQLTGRATTLVPLLDFLEAAGWPPRINDALDALPRERKSRKEQLHDAIKRLNRGQHVLRFHGTGDGHGIWWEVVAE